MWADTSTFSGPDENPYFDADDELVFMARHLGERRPDQIDLPMGVTGELQLELEITDPLFDGIVIGFAYIFIQDGSLRQDAGMPLVDYDFQLEKHDSQGTNSYFTAYEFDCMHGAHGGQYECRDPTPKNPEDTWFTSKYYERHFAENWYTDEVHIFADGASGENFWNAQEFQILPKTCGRCVNTFRNGKTGFVINKSGPVRAIRSWVGANSGTLTQRESILYEQREDQHTYLRAHTLPGLMDYVNYKQDVPLTYYNCRNTHGIKIDGIHADDVFDDTFCDWEGVQGATGTYLRTSDIHINALDYVGVYDLAPENIGVHWFYDDDEPIKNHVTEDGAALFEEMLLCTTLLNNQLAAWGTHGWGTHSIRNDHFLIDRFNNTRVEMILNTDPLRYQFYDPRIFDHGACDIEVVEPWKWRFNVTYHQYYLGPAADVLELGPKLRETGLAKLERKPVPYCYSCPGMYPLDGETATTTATTRRPRTTTTTTADITTATTTTTTTTSTQTPDTGNASTIYAPSLILFLVTGFLGFISTCL